MHARVCSADQLALQQIQTSRTTPFLCRVDVIFALDQPMRDDHQENRFDDTFVRGRAIDDADVDIHHPSMQQCAGVKSLFYELEHGCQQESAKLDDMFQTTRLPMSDIYQDHKVLRQRDPFEIYLCQMSSNFALLVGAQLEAELVSANAS